MGDGGKGQRGENGPINRWVVKRSSPEAQIPNQARWSVVRGIQMDTSWNERLTENLTWEDLWAQIRRETEEHLQ